MPAERPGQTPIDGLFAVVLTLNEAAHLPACLASVAFAERVLVIDSGSTDDTCAIARGLGAEVHVHADWQGFGVQRTRALAHCAAARYVLFLDADETIPQALQAELRAVIASDARGAWAVEWDYVAFGVPLRHMKSTRGMLRFFSRAELLGFEGAVHESARLAPGTPVRALSQHLVHRSFESVDGGLSKLRQYALLGAAKYRTQGRRGGVLRGLASALAVFVRLYVFKRAFLDGGAGFLFCYFLAQEHFFRYAALHYDQSDLTEAIRR